MKLSIEYIDIHKEPDHFTEWRDSYSSSVPLYAESSTLHVSPPTISIIIRDMIGYICSIYIPNRSSYSETIVNVACNMFVDVT